MSRKHVLYAFNMFDEVDASTDQISAITHVAQSDKASIYVSWSNGSTFSGTLEVQVRQNNKEVPELPWFTLDLGTAITLSGASGDHQIYLTEMPFDQVRLNFTNSAGSADLTATIFTKTVGA